MRNRKSLIKKQCQFVIFLYIDSLANTDLFFFLQVERVEIKDVLLPQSMQRSMAAEAESAREARAKAREQTNQINITLRTYIAYFYPESI